MVVDDVPNAVPAASRDMIDLAEHSPSLAWRADPLCTGKQALIRCWCSDLLLVQIVRGTAGAFPFGDGCCTSGDGGTAASGSSGDASSRSDAADPSGLLYSSRPSRQRTRSGCGRATPPGA
jgi:hypothetical protein